MNISKKVPVIVSIVLVLIWVFLGYRSAMRIDGLTADPVYNRKVTITEDVRVVDRAKTLEEVLSDGKQYDYSDIPSGSTGSAWISYSRRYSYINDPETDVHAFEVSFYLDDDPIRAAIKTGPESLLDEDDIYYKKIENYEEIISEYNQKVKEAKAKWGIQLLLRILTGLAVAAVFSIFFLLECIVANKIKMHPVVFGIISFIYVLMLLFAMFVSTFF